MRSALDRLGGAPVHPFLFASLFVVYLLAANLDDQVGIGDVLGVLGIVLLAVAGVFALLLAAIRNVRLAAVVTSVAVVWVFLYGPTNEYLAAEPGQPPLDPMLWSIVGLIALAAAFAARAHVVRLTQALNLVAAILLLFNLAPVVPHQIATATAPTYVAPGVESLPGLPDGHAADRRDIYYIILDRYPSQTTLMSTAYGFDNSPFLSQLERLGFYIAEDSRANYIQTALSVASSLNMDYLDAAEMKRVAPSPRDWKSVYDMLAGSLAAPKVLEEQGYTYVQLPSWFAATAAGEEVDVRYRVRWLSEFGHTLLNTTVVPKLLALAGIAPDKSHIENALYQFSKLPALDDIPGPKFVFAHILLPHPPFVFDADGPVPVDERKPDDCCDPTGRFLAQLQYTNRRVLEVVNDLLAGPVANHPIILIQADEGPRPADPVQNWREASLEQVQQKFGILNAYYFPGVQDPGLYASISPVNSFRVLFNDYFGAELPLLDDRVLAFGTAPSLYDYVDITDRFQTSSIEGIDGDVVPSAPSEWVAGTSQSYQVRLTNTGEVAWPRDGADATALYVQFAPASTDPQLGWSGGQRVGIDQEVGPGESLTIEVTARAPDLDGEYRLRHRMAHGISWFRAGLEEEVSVVSPRDVE